MRSSLKPSLWVEAGYRVEAVSPGVTRVTFIYSIQPGGFMSHFRSCVNHFEQLFLMGLPGLRDMINQIPEYHIFNLIERIVKGILPLPKTPEQPRLSTLSTQSAPTPVDSQLSGEGSETDDTQMKLPLPPYITNTVPHASQCETMVGV